MFFFQSQFYKNIKVKCLMLFYKWWEMTEWHGCRFLFVAFIFVFFVHMCSVVHQFTFLNYKYSRRNCCQKWFSNTPAEWRIQSDIHTSYLWHSRCCYTAVLFPQCYCDSNVTEVNIVKLPLSWCMWRIDVFAKLSNMHCMLNVETRIWFEVVWYFTIDEYVSEFNKM